MVCPYSDANSSTSYVEPPLNVVGNAVLWTRLSWQQGRLICNSELNPEVSQPTEVPTQSPIQSAEIKPGGGVDGPSRYMSAVKT